MRDPAASRPAGAGDYLRVLLARRRGRSRRLAAAFATVVCAASLASIAWRPAPVLLWNASASAPAGLYFLWGRGAVRRGGMAVARLAGPEQAFAAQRRYLPAAVPLVKRVAAIAGDRVCAVGPLITINGRWAAVRRLRDPAGRLMVWWDGCRRLRAGEVFLLSANPLSFDGRYFGVTPKCQLLGGAELIWAS
jgi:type IV secretory pathway protease TraF